MDVILNGCRGFFLQIELWECRNTLCISNDQSAEMEEKNRQAVKIPSKEMLPINGKRGRLKAFLCHFLP